MAYDAVFYLVTDDTTKRIGDPGTRLYNEHFTEVTVQDIKDTGKKNIEIRMMTEENFDLAKNAVLMGGNLNWGDGNGDDE